MATVHPYRGYINSVFNFYAKGLEDITYEVYSVNTKAKAPILSGVFTPNIPFSIKLNNPGEYEVCFGDGSSTVIFVEDGYKFGGSTYKHSYIFDETPWCFVIMNDRTYFYNRETEESYVEAISPDVIKAISPEYVILENEGQKEQTIYSLNEQKPILNRSNIIFYNNEVVIWKEQLNNNTCIEIYSLKDRIIVKSAHVIDCIIDRDQNTLIYQVDNSLHKQELSLPLKDEQIMRTRGKLTSLVAPNIAISIEKLYNSYNVYVFDTRRNKTISTINDEEEISSINDLTLIDTNERIDTINGFDFSKIGYDEARIKITYHSYQFYPTKWDVFCLIEEKTYEKGPRRGHYSFGYTVKSLTTKDEFLFDSSINKVITKDHVICFLNHDELLVCGKNVRPEYSKNVIFYTHINDILKSSAGVIETLDDINGWQPIGISNCLFRYFEEFGIIKDKNSNTYIDLHGNTFCGYVTECNFPFRHLTIGDRIIRKDGIILPCLEASISLSGIYYLTREDDGIFLHCNKSNSIQCKKILSDMYDTSQYESVLLSEDGSQIMHRDGEQTVVLDLQTAISDRYDNLSYIKHINGIRPLFSQRPGALQPRLVDPVTRQIISSDRMAAFLFVSPDGSLYADTEINKYIETWDLITNEKLSNTDEWEYSKRFNYDDLDTETATIKKSNRRRFIQRNFSVLKDNYKKTQYNSKLDDELFDLLVELPYREFSKLFLKKEGVAYIRSKINDTVVAKIGLGSPLWYLNYVSFSYDNRFVAIAGRYPNESNYGGLFLVYDLINKKEIIVNRSSWAVWVTSFNKFNQVAAYSSEPISYDSILSCEGDDICTNSHEGFSFLTFSPDGRYVALSNQGYVSKYHKNGNSRLKWGHQPSCNVFIAKSSAISSILNSFSDLSNVGIDGLSNKRQNFPKTVASVSFSNDNKRLMMVGNDGVVIIRNLHLSENTNDASS